MARAFSMRPVFLLRVSLSGVFLDGWVMAGCRRLRPKVSFCRTRRRGETASKRLILPTSRAGPAFRAAGALLPGGAASGAHKPPFLPVRLGAQHCVSAFPVRICRLHSRCLRLLPLAACGLASAYLNEPESHAYLCCRLRASRAAALPVRKSALVAPVLRRLFWCPAELQLGSCLFLPQAVPVAEYDKADRRG